MALIVFQSEEALADAASEMVTELLREAVHKRGIAHLALSGGGTPRPTYERLAAATDMPWEKIHIWWADERAVHQSSPESNFYLANEAFLDAVQIPIEQVHRILGELDPSAAADTYVDELRRAAAPGELFPRLDVAVLGMGADGHTASLFPGDVPDEEVTRPAIAVRGDYDGRPAERVTLTPLMLNAARQILFLVTGERKASVLRQVLNHEAGSVDLIETLPVTRVRPTGGHIAWLVDQAAAGEIESESGNRLTDRSNSFQSNRHLINRKSDYERDDVYRDLRRDRRSQPPQVASGFVQPLSEKAFAGAAYDSRTRPKTMGYS